VGVSEAAPTLSEIARAPVKTLDALSVAAPTDSLTDRVLVPAGAAFQLEMLRLFP
jgi:hypothetical protein